MKQKFTGRHMATILVIFFGVVFAVNMLMATLAISGFGGVIVQNSYVASQNFNSWLDEAEQQRALGWQVEMARNDAGRLQVTTQGAPEDSTVTARLRRPLGQNGISEWNLSPAGPNLYVTNAPLPEGRWIVRLTVSSDGQTLKVEQEI